MNFGYLNCMRHKAREISSELRAELLRRVEELAEDVGRLVDGCEKTRLLLAAEGGYSATSITNYLGRKNEMNTAKLAMLVAAAGGVLRVLRLARAAPHLDATGIEVVEGLVNSTERRVRTLGLRVVS